MKGNSKIHDVRYYDVIMHIARCKEPTIYWDQIRNEFLKVSRNYLKKETRDWLVLMLNRSMIQSF